ncbi:MAG: hypothetical protein SPH36_07875, partial [Candidatus Cryptobacteroides sp.]|nr:hypothetical protein [Candidatus Cryptobacteroides sp.]
DEARKELKLCRCVVFHTSKVRSFDTQTYLQVYVYVTLCHGTLQVSLYGSLIPAIQFTVFGVSFGKKVFGFVETGGGTEYFSVHGGIGYRF